MPDSEVKQQSEFNDALGYLRRINACLYSADVASMNLDVYGWFQALLAFYRELSTEIKPDQTQGFRQTITELNSFTYDISTTGKVMYNAPAGFHDDIVIAHALAIWSLTPMPTYIKPIEKPLIKQIYEQKIEQQFESREDSEWAEWNE